jgi:hypothetical protein
MSALLPMPVGTNGGSTALKSRWSRPGNGRSKHGFHHLQNPDSSIVEASYGRAAECFIRLAIDKEAQPRPGQAEVLRAMGHNSNITVWRPWCAGRTFYSPQDLVKTGSGPPNAGMDPAAMR